MARGGERWRRGKGEIGVKIQGAQIVSSAVGIGKAVAAAGDKRAESNYGIFPYIGAAAGWIVLVARRTRLVIISPHSPALGNQSRVNAQIIVAVEAH